jgi:hypothetical protein
MRSALLLAWALLGCSAPASSLVELAAGQSPSSITSDGVNVYWTNSKNSSGDVMKCDVAGCGERPTRLAVAGAPAGIAVSGSDVYFTDVAAGAVSKTPIAGGEVSRIGVANDPWGITLAGGRVFWTTNATRGPVMACPEGGCVGAPANLAGGDASFAIATDGANVYWSDWNAIWSCPLEGCVGGSAEGGTPQLGSGTPTAIAAASGHVALAVDDANVYWAYADEGVVLSCKKRGCGEPVVVATHQEGASALASDGAHVYWITDKSVMACATTGCATGPTELASLDAPGGGLALDATSIYFWSGDRIFKLAK